MPDADYDALMADLRVLLAEHTVEAYSPAIRFSAVSADALRALLDQHDAARPIPPAEPECGPCRRGQHGCCDGGLYVQCDCCGMATGGTAAATDRERLAEVLAAITDPIHAGGCHYRHQQGETDECNSCTAHRIETAAVDALAGMLAEARAEAWESAAREAQERGDIGKDDGGVEAWVWLRGLIRRAALTAEADQ